MATSIKTRLLHLTVKDMMLHPLRDTRLTPVLDMARLSGRVASLPTIRTSERAIRGTLLGPKTDGRQSGPFLQETTWGAAGNWNSIIENVGWVAIGPVDGVWYTRGTFWTTGDRTRRMQMYSNTVRQAGLARSTASEPGWVPS